jgi:hypothetical protein
MTGNPQHVLSTAPPCKRSVLSLSRYSIYASKHFGKPPSRSWIRLVECPSYLVLSSTHCRTTHAYVLINEIGLPLLLCSLLFVGLSFIDKSHSWTRVVEWTHIDLLMRMYSSMRSACPCYSVLCCLSGSRLVDVPKRKAKYRAHRFRTGITILRWTLVIARCDEFHLDAHLFLSLSFKWAGPVEVSLFLVFSGFGNLLEYSSRVQASFFVLARFSSVSGFCFSFFFLFSNLNRFSELNYFQIWTDSEFDFFNIWTI